MGGKSPFTAEQIAYALKQVEAGVPMAEVYREYGTSQQTYYRWRTKFGEIAPSEVRRLEELESENAKLKRIVRTSPSTRRSCTTPFEKSPEGHPAPRAGERSAGGACSQRAQSLRWTGIRARLTPLPIHEG